MTNQQKKEAIRSLRIVKKEFNKLHKKAWKGDVINVGKHNDILMILKYTFKNIEQLINCPVS